MKELKYLNICYHTKNINEEFNISSYINNFLEYKNDEELIQLINNKNIHLVITKYDFEFLKKIRLLNNQIQIIAIQDEINHTHLLESLEIEYIKFVKNLNCINEFIEILKDCVKNIDSNKSNIIILNDDFIYDKYNKIVFKKNNILQLTKKETCFLDFLITNHNISISYEDINKEVWDGEMSQDALRSLVKEIRKKTYKELIKNVSGIGYRIDIL
uniref:winged helix-turn-helix domain-containing protein n=1 Tax=Aliarcobacter sp. TaxID=2321116 RepID=UPI004048CF5C